MYLTADQVGLALLCRMVDRFSSREMHFDTFNWLGIRAQMDQHRRAAFGCDAALGHQRPGRHPRGGARHPAAGLGLTVRLRHL